MPTSFVHLQKNYSDAWVGETSIPGEMFVIPILAYSCISPHSICVVKPNSGSSLGSCIFSFSYTWGTQDSLLVLLAHTETHSHGCWWPLSVIHFVHEEAVNLLSQTSSNSHFSLVQRMLVGAVCDVCLCPRKLPIQSERARSARGMVKKLLALIDQEPQRRRFKYKPFHFHSFLMRLACMYFPLYK